MGEKKSIRLSSGDSVETDYAGLKELFTFEGEISKVSKSLLKFYFPIESQLDRNGKNKPFDRRRWQAWFNAENSRQRRLEAQVANVDPGECLGITPQMLSANTNQRLLALAKLASQREPKGRHRNRVSDFTDWIFQLEHASTRYGKEAGAIGERAVQKQRKRYPSPKIFDTDWALWFEDDLTDAGDAFEISSMRVNGSSMYGKPDYVFMNKKTLTALIVEVKTSDAETPADGWPNLRAQLWAYGQIDAICAEAVNIILIGEIWTSNNGVVGRRKTYSWDMSDGHFFRENEALFQCYQQYASKQ